jgi:hypothetical protein
MTNTLAELGKNVQKIAKEYSLEEYPIAIVVSPKCSASPMPFSQMTNTGRIRQKCTENSERVQS